MLRRIAPLLTAVLLAGCVLSSAGGSKAPAAEGALLPTDTIEITTLDVASPEGVAAPAPDVAASSEAPLSNTLPDTAPPTLPDAAASAPPARPAVASEVTPTEAPVEMPAEPVAPVELLSPEGQACVDQGGMWVPVGDSEAMTCVSPTRDSGKLCDGGDDCEGECLARSGTCAPFTPLFGCNDVLDDSGRRMTLCLD